MPLVWSLVISTLVGYLIGSVSPAWILGRLLRRIDIRTVGYRNAGTRNVFTTLGWGPAAITAVVDTGKGVAAVLLARSVIGVTGYGLLLPAAAAVAGHIAPFYLGFRGGRGAAAAVGLWLFVIGEGLVEGVYPPAVFGGVLGVAGLLYSATRSGDATGLGAFFLMGLSAVLELGFRPEGVLAITAALYLFVHALFRSGELGLYVLPEGREMIGWRVLARPAALLFIPLSFIVPRPAYLGLLVLLAAAAAALDVYRIVAGRQWDRAYKSGERRRPSSITWFLVSVLLLAVLFTPYLAAAALGFLVLGDLGSKLLGIKFGKHLLLGNRTLEGSVGFLIGSLTAGYAISRILGAPTLPVVVAGAAGAAIIELLSVGIDDNLTVGLGSAGLMALLTTLAVPA